MSTILIVEDDAELRRVIGFALMDVCYQCEEAGNGEEALQALCRATGEGWAYGAVVLDILMPGAVDGWQVLESMRANPLWQKIPVIVLTGKATLPAEIERARQLGAQHMQKTARFVDELLDRIQALAAPEAPGSR